MRATDLGGQLTLAIPQVTKGTQRFIEARTEKKKKVISEKPHWYTQVPELKIVYTPTVSSHFAEELLLGSCHRMHQSATAVH